MKIKFTISPSNVLQNERNCYFEEARVITSLEEFKEICRHDYTCAQFKKNYRKTENFLYADSIPMDVDNTHSDNPKEWVTIDTIKRAFPDVPFLVHYSRNHMKEKEGKLPRPKFHVIFPIHDINDAKTLQEQKLAVLDLFPYFDKEALGAYRFFFGTSEPSVEYIDGNTYIDDFIEKEKRDLEEFENLGYEIKEGTRNKTMYKIAVSLLKRYGNEEITHQKYDEVSTRCNPPLEDAELKSIFNSALKFYNKVILPSKDYIKPSVYNSTSATSWDELIPLRQNDLPSFPLDALPPVIKDYCKAVSESLQSPIDMACVCALATLATAMQGTYKVKIKDNWEEPTNLFCLVIANPSERKSPVLKVMTNVLHHFELLDNERNKLIIFKSKMDSDNLMKEFKSISKKFKNNEVSEEEYNQELKKIISFKQRFPLVLAVDDITPEALALRVSQQNGKMAVISSEGGFIDIITGTYSEKANLDIVLKGYSGDSFKVDRITRPGTDFIPNVYLTILLTVQPKVVEKMVSHADLEQRGMNARFLFSFPNSMVGKRIYDTEGINEQVKRKYTDLIVSILEEKKPEGEITFFEDADDVFKKFYEEIEVRLTTDLKPLISWAGKLCGSTARIAGLLARANNVKYDWGSYALDHKLFEQNDENGSVFIFKEDAENAIKIAKYFIEHAKYAFNSMGLTSVTKIAIDIVDYIKTLGSNKEEISTGELCRHFRNLKINDLTPVLELLVNYGYLEPKEKETKAGRPSNIYLINPSIFKEEN